MIVDRSREGKQESQQERLIRSSSIHYKHFFFESLVFFFIGRVCQTLPKPTTTRLAPRQMPRRFSFARQACFHPITIYNSYHRPFNFAASPTSPPVYGVIKRKVRTAQQQIRKHATNPPSPSASAPCLHHTPPATPPLDNPSHKMSTYRLKPYFLRS